MGGCVACKPKDAVAGGDCTKAGNVYNPGTTPRETDEEREERLRKKLEKKKKKEEKQRKAEQENMEGESSIKQVPPQGGDTPKGEVTVGADDPGTANPNNPSFGEAGVSDAAIGDKKPEDPVLTKD